MERNLPQYRLLQLGAPDRNDVQRNESFNDLEGLVTHHPGKNRNAEVVNGVVVRGEKPAKRSHAVVGGEIQEVELARTDEYHALGPAQVLLVKDFILEDSRIASGQRGVRQVDVPSPLAGYIGRIDAGNGVVDILDGPDGEVIARARHLNPIGVQAGDMIGYGQSLGTQNNQGLKPTDGKHVHFEIDTRHYQHYANYVDDLHSGRLSIDPDRRIVGIEARPVVDDGVIRIGESTDIVKTVQRRLNEEGFRGADNRPLEVDGVYRLSMQAAVINYQQARGLPLSGDIDPVTLQYIAPRIYPPAVNDEHRQDGGDRELPRYMWRHSGVEGNNPAFRAIDDPLLPQAERAVRQLDQTLGREYNGQSACMAASAACLAKATGLSRIDHVLLSEERGTVRQGENLFVVQGELGDPAQRRAQMQTQDAINTPVGQSLAQLQALNEAQQRQPAQDMEAPGREISPPQMRMG